MKSIDRTFPAFCHKNIDLSGAEKDQTIASVRSRMIRLKNISPDISTSPANAAVTGIQHLMMFVKSTCGNASDEVQVYQAIKVNLLAEILGRR